MTSFKWPAQFTSRVIRAAGDRIGARPRTRRLCVLGYHRVLNVPDPLLTTEPDVAAFRWQMEMLAECFNVLPLHEAVMALVSDDIPPRAVCITFDDGYRSLYDFALPILSALGLPATVFVATDCISKGNMWNDRIIETVRRLPYGKFDLSEIGLGTYSIQSADDRYQLVYRLIEEFKYLPPASRLELTKKVEAAAKTAPVMDLMMSSEMVRDIAKQGIEVGGHTITHPILKSLDDNSALHEIAGNKQQLEAITGKPVRLFAYPNGKPDKDFDMRHVRMVKEAGYSAAFTTALGAATKAHDPFQLPRSRPWDTNPFLYAARLLRWLQK